MTEFTKQIVNYRWERVTLIDNKSGDSTTGVIEVGLNTSVFMLKNMGYTAKDYRTGTPILALFTNRSVTRIEDSHMHMSDIGPYIYCDVIKKP